MKHWFGRSDRTDLIFQPSWATEGASWGSGPWLMLGQIRLRRGGASGGETGGMSKGGNHLKSGERRMIRIVPTMEVEVVPPGLEGSLDRRSRVHLANLRGRSMLDFLVNPSISEFPIITSAGHDSPWSTPTIAPNIFEVSIHEECCTAPRASRRREPHSAFTDPPPKSPAPCRWLIDGFPATLFVWTAEEWARLNDRPRDAQQCSNGIWCALRME